MIIDFLDHDGPITAAGNVKYYALGSNATVVAIQRIDGDTVQTVWPSAALAFHSRDLLEACIEATSLFDNYPDLHEAKGTFEVLHNAIRNAGGAA